MDSICINQSDPNERNHQVRLMQKIYGLAEHVFFHLGQQTDLAEKALDRRFVQVDGQLCRRWEYGGLPRDVMVDLASVFNKSRYARRLWVIQELVLGRQVSLVLNDCIIPLPELEEGTRKEQAAQGKRVGKPDGFLVKILNARQRWHLTMTTDASPRGSRLSSLLWDYRRHRCKLVSDRVYALLGICCEAIPIDYNLSPRKLSLSILAHLIPKQPDLPNGSQQISVLIISLEAVLSFTLPEEDYECLSQKLKSDHKRLGSGDVSNCWWYCENDRLLSARLTFELSWDIGYDSTQGAGGAKKTVS